MELLRKFKSLKCVPSCRMRFFRNVVFRTVNTGVMMTGSDFQTDPISGCPSPDPRKRYMMVGSYVSSGPVSVHILPHT